MYDIVDIAELELLVAAQERSLQGPEGASLSVDHFRRQLQKARPQSSTIKWRRFLEDTLIANSKKLKERHNEPSPPAVEEVSDPGIEPATSETELTKREDIVAKSTPTCGSSNNVLLPTGQPLVINVQAPAPSPAATSLNSTGEIALLHTAELEVTPTARSNHRSAIRYYDVLCLVLLRGCSTRHHRMAAGSRQRRRRGRSDWKSRSVVLRTSVLVMGLAG